MTKEIPRPSRVTAAGGPYWVTGVKSKEAVLLEALVNLMDYLADPANPKPGLGAKNVFRQARTAIAAAKGLTT